MCVIGGVFVEKVITERLTDYVWLGGSPFDSTRSNFAARLFAALRSAISSLKKYYASITPSQLSTYRPYPFITEYGEQKTKFTYSSRLATEYQHRLLYRATLNGVPSTRIVVKFVEQYNADAHRLLATQSLAPRLHYSSTDDNVRYGKRFMVVMDYVDLKRVSGRLTQQQYECVKNAIDILHSKDMVFGDLRWPNILVGNNTAMLIDFDWCGKAGEARYPHDINIDASMGWHKDVGPDCFMTLDHDDHMLRNLML